MLIENVSFWTGFHYAGNLTPKGSWWPEPENCNFFQGMLIENVPFWTGLQNAGNRIPNSWWPEPENDHFLYGTLIEKVKNVNRLPKDRKSGVLRAAGRPSLKISIYYKECQLKM
jgi:hypothetical protein